MRSAMPRYLNSRKWGRLGESMLPQRPDGLQRKPKGDPAICEENSKPRPHRWDRATGGAISRAGPPALLGLAAQQDA